jgi:hypothetical protein
MENGTMSKSLDMRFEYDYDPDLILEVALEELAAQGEQADLDDLLCLGGCGETVSPDNPDQICYQCQCHYQMLGAFDMDNAGWS